MGFPATTVDGETVIITEKGNQGQREMLRAEDGRCFFANQDGKLIPHPDNAPLANLEGFVPDTEVDQADEAPTEEQGEPIEETDDGVRLISPIEQFETMLNERADAEATELDGTLADGIEDGNGEEAEAPEAA